MNTLSINQVLSNYATTDKYLLLENSYDFRHGRCNLNIITFNDPDVIGSYIAKTWFEDFTYEEFTNNDSAYNTDYNFVTHQIDDGEFRMTTNIMEGNYVIFKLYKGDKKVLSEIITSFYKHLLR